MRSTLARSPSLTKAGDPRLRLRFLLLEVRIWRRCERPRFTFPVAVFLKRLEAPLCVFNFGIEPQNQLSAVSCQQRQNPRCVSMCIPVSSRNTIQADSEELIAEIFFVTPASQPVQLAEPVVLRVLVSGLRAPAVASACGRWSLLFWAPVSRAACC